MGPALSRLADKIPGERLEGRTIVVGLVTMVVVLGLSASVLGSRGNNWLASLAPAAASPAMPAAAAKCPAHEASDEAPPDQAPPGEAPPDQAPPPIAVVRPLEPEVRRHVATRPATGHPHRSRLAKAPPKTVGH